VGRSGGEVTQMNNGEALLKTAPNNCVKIIKKTVVFFVFWIRRMQRAPKPGKKYRVLEKRFHFGESRPEVLSSQATFIEKIHYLCEHYLVSRYIMQNCGIQLIMLPTN
jgi:hypothetical protein